MSEKYSYGPDNLRVYKQHPNGSEELYFNGLRGEKLQVYNTASPLSPWGGGGANPYFAGRLVDGNYRDRLGSVQWFWRYGGPPPTYTGYYPYGEEYTTTTQDREKFATYFRDATTGLDYAKKRYYSSILGRFMSADPYRDSAGPADPGSWNRYAYTRNDPVNRYDPWGLDDCLPEEPCLIDSGGGSSGSSNSGTGRDDVGRIRKAREKYLDKLFNFAAMALKADASQFAKDLVSGNIGKDCSGDIGKLGITADQWAEALSNALILNGIGSTVPLASLLAVNSPEWKVATSRGLTVGNEFGPKSGNVAVSSLNGNEVYISPFLVNPGDFTVDSALIAHEVLHNLGMDDPTIQTKLGIPVTTNTVNIGNKLQTDCFGPSGPLPQP